MKRNLVLLHGWGVNARVWNSVLPRLSESFAVTALDLPGYGKQAHRRTGTDLEVLAADVLSRAPIYAVWCGWSFGGMIAMAAALQQPKRIEKLSLVCTSPRFMEDADWTHGCDESTLAKLATQFQQDYKKAVARFFLLQLGSNERIRSRELVDTLTQAPAPSWNSLEDGLNLLRTIDLRDKLADIAIETSVIAGAQDRVMPRDGGRHLAERIPNAKLLETDSGHAPFITSPDWFVDQLQEFVGANR